MSNNNNNSHRFTASIQVNLHQPASPVKNWRFLLVQSFNAHMPLLTATSIFRLERRRWSSPQQCYLHYTVSVPKGFTFNQCQICYFRDVLPSRQSLGMALKKLNKIRQKQTCISNKLYFNTKWTQKLKPGFVAFYDLRPGKGMDLFSKKYVKK